MRMILAAILTAAIATPVAADSLKKTDTLKIKKARSVDAYAYAPVTPRFTQDVYVNGVYVGSDPDWRVRETLRRENIGGGGSDH